MNFALVSGLAAAAVIAICFLGALFYWRGLKAGIDKELDDLAEHDIESLKATPKFDGGVGIAELEVVAEGTL